MTHFVPTDSPLPLGTCVVALGPKHQVAITTRPKDPGQVCLPGGKVEEGEGLAEAAAREFREETGARIHADQLLPVFTGVCPGDGPVPWYRVTLFFLTDPLADLPGSEEPDIQAFFGEVARLLTDSPFASYNAPALRTLAADLRALAFGTMDPLPGHPWIGLATTIEQALTAHRQPMHD